MVEPLPTGPARAARRLRFSVAQIRSKLFILNSCAVAVPIAILVAYFARSQTQMFGEMLSRKATQMTQLLAKQLAPAIAFDDQQTAREALGGASDDDDVVYLALYRANGEALHSIGFDPERAPAAVPTHSHQVESADELRAVTPVDSVEGPRGTLVVGFSKSGIAAASARANHTAILIGLGALALGCLATWLVGTSLARRIRRVKSSAERVAAGDLSLAPLSDSSNDEIGQMARAFQVMVGVVEHKVAERTAELAASRDQLRRLLESTHAIPWRLDPATRRISYLGPQATDTFGASLTELLDADYWRAHMSPGELQSVQQVLTQTAKTGKDAQLVFEFQRADGRRVWIRALTCLVTESGRPSIIGFMFDVTSQRQLEIDLRQAQKLESVGRLAAGVAHEINTPIQFVNDSVHFIGDVVTDVFALLSEYRALHDRMRALGLSAEVEQCEERAAELDLEYLRTNTPKAVERSLDGLERVGAIVGAMRQFAHPERDNMAAADINAALSATLTIARNEYKFFADAITDFGDLPRVTCHIGELNQVFLNIIVNAAHAISDHNAGTEARGCITLETRVEARDVIVRIRDTGGGIPEAIQGRIFDPFFTTKDVGRGTGQGLAIARSVVVDKHAGSLTFESVQGLGTTFEIRLPITPIESERVAGLAA